MERNVESKLQDSEPPTPQSVVKMGLRDRGSMEDPDGTLASVAQCIEQLRRSSSSAQEKESSLKQLLDLINARDSAFSAVGSHSQAVPILVSLLRSGSFQVKVQAAKVLGSLCKDDELRVKVLLGGCIPPLLGLLRSSSAEGQIAAANTIFAVSQGGARDHVGSKIFSTEGVVPVLWKQLQNGLTTENLVEDQLTGALRNLSSSTEGFWSATIEAGGVEILVKLLTTGQSSTLANVCFLLGCMMMEDASVCSRVLSAQATKQLLKLLGSGNEDSVRAEAAGALKSLSAQCKDARREIASCNGIPALINATIAPSKEFMQGEYAQGLQENAMSALANISGGLSYVISSLGESLSSCTSPSQTADTLGALASALMIFDDKAESIRASEPAVVEKTLVKQFKTKLPFLVQERTIEALASLYGNAVLSKKLINSDAKRLLVGLITMATNEDVQDELVRSLLRLCNSEGSLWLALQGRDGVQLLISLLGLSSEQQQECAVALLSLLAKENDESKWAITAAGGIPPLVQILEIGSVKAKEDSALILGNLCNHSEDIRACVESADAVPALLWLLKNGSQNGKDIAAKTLNHLIHKSDTGTISQLTALLTSDIPESKVHILDALKSLLSVAPIQELLREGTAPNDAIETMIKLLNSAQEETQAESASALAFLFDLRKDLRESTIALETLLSAIKLLNVHSEQILKQSSCCLASIFLSIKQNKDVAAIARDTLAPLVLLANSPVLEVAEQATRALANLLLDSEVSAEAFPEDIIMPVTRILHEGGTIDGRTHAAAAVARLLQFRTIDVGISDCVNRAGTVLALVSLLESATVESVATTEALEALALLSRSKASGSQIKPTWAILAEVPDTIEPIVSCIANAPSVLQDKAIEVLCRLCQNQSVVLGNSIGASSVCISSIARRIISSKHRTVQVGGTALLICAAKVNHQRVIEALNESNLCIYLIQSLVEMLRFVQSSDERVENGSKEDISINRETRKQNRAGEFGSSTHVISGENLGIWLLSVLARYENKSKIAILETGAVEVLTDKISKYLSQVTESDSTEDSNAWVCALLLAILFQDRDVIRVHATMRSVPALANILKLEETTNKYFAAQALASLVCNGSRGTLLTVSNSGVANGLISLLGCADTDIHDLLELSEEFALVRNPEEVALERLFRVDDIRNGATSRKAIPALVDLLKPIPDRPRAPFLALGILNHLARDSPTNKIVMVEAGILEALTKYLSLGPQDATEEAAADLLGVLFSSADVRKHESTFGALNQLVAVLRLGGRGARYSAAKALESLFSSDHIRNTDTARQAIQPLVEILNTGFEREQHATIAALIKLLCDGPSRALVVADVELNAVDVLCRILSSNCSLELKGDAAELCYVLFGNTRIRSTNAASRCVEPLVSLLVCEFSPTQHSVVRALDKLMEDEPLADLVAAYGAVIPLVGLLFGQNYSLHEDISRALVKLGKDRPACKMEMVKAGVIESILDIFHEAPHFLCSVFAELLRILTNNSNIAKGPSAAKVIEPIFLLITRPELGPDGQHSSLQVLVNIMEHPQGRANHSLSPYQAILPLVPLLDSHVQAVQQLAAELLSYMLLEERFQKDPTTQQAIGPLIRVLGSGNQISQQKALRALSSIALSWPNEIAKEGGVTELSKVILQSDPPLPHVSWESAASILSSILQFSSEYYLEVPVAVLVKLLHSGTENTVTGALNALLVLESDDSNTTVAMAESGAIEALLELLRSHQSEETAARLLEVLLNNVKVRETKIAKAAISPLSQYLLDPQTQAQQARLLATLALGDLFQAEGLARTTDALSACRALVNVLEDQPTEEMKVVAICALQNLVMYSRSNKRAVAEAGGVQVVLDLIGSSNPDTSVQAAMFIKLLFSNNTIQEYASSETVRVITVIIEKDLWATGSVNEEYLKTLNALLGNFPRLRATEPATLCIPHLITALKTGSEPTQEAALDSLFLLRQAWSACPAEVSQAQSVAAAEAIPFLQYLIQSGPPRFQEKVELLLQCLPGTLVVIIKRGNNLKQSVGNASAYCKVTLGHNPPKLTKIADGPTPEWDESFSWAFESPPKGQKLHISCKNKSKFGKKKFGKVTIQIDRVVMLGAVAGEYALLPESRSGPRNLEIEFLWSNKLQAS